MNARWVLIALVVAIALFAIVVGGFLWPRPQFERGRTPWTLEDSASNGESLAPATTPDDSPP